MADQPPVTKWVQIARAERKVYCYGGDSCEEHVPQWWAYFEGDKDSDQSNQPLTLNPEHFKAGTKVTIESPVCPICEEIPENCEAMKCRFDWKKWAEDQYA